MNFTLNILDENGVALDVSALTIASQAISVTDVATDSFAGLTLEPGNTYDIVFPADATTDVLSSSTVSFPEDATLNFNLAAGELTAGVTKSITVGATAITNFTVGVVSQAADTYDGTVLVQGEDITITIDGNVNTGVNSATETVADDATIEISVVSAGYHTYTNTVRVYDYDVDVDIKLIPVVSDPLDPNYRRAYPYFFYILEPCSYNIHIYNAQSAPYGVISYYHSQDVANTFATATNTVLDTCTPDTVSITQRIVVRQIANCGGTSPIIWDETYTINGIETTEYLPELILARSLNCCENIDVEIAINPQSINLNNDGIHACDMSLIATALEYIITEPDGTETVLATYDGTTVETAITTPDYSTVGFTFTPTQLGTHTLTINLTDCCETVSTTHTFDVCSSWLVTNTNCNIIEVSNLSAVESLIFTIKELTDYSTFEVVTVNSVPQQNIVVNPGTTTEIDLSIDGLYTINISRAIPDSEGEYIFVLDCNIKKCKKELLRNFLCGEDECDTATQVQNMIKLTEFVTLEKIIYQKWDEWKQQQSVINTFSINDIMEDVITLSKAIASINKICSSCGITNSCSSSQRTTCNYTLTNWGYLVSARSASIIIPNNGTDCGCS